MRSRSDGVTPGRGRDRGARASTVGATAVGPGGRLVVEGEAERRNPLEKAFRILAWVADRGQASWGVREVARELGMAPSTAFRVLSALEKAEVVVSNGSGQFHLALEFFRLASRIASDVPIRRAALPRLVDLMQTTGETVYLGVYGPVQRKMMYIDVVESPHPVQYTMARYEWFDLYAGAGGLGILPFLPEAEIEQVLSTTELKRFTADTITDPAALRRELAKIRAAGYVVSVGQRIVGAVGIAAPIFGPDRRVMGDIVLALPSSRFSRRDGPVLGRHVADAADAVSADLGAGGQSADGTWRPT